MQQHTESITDLFFATYGQKPDMVYKLPQSGSDRIYYRVQGVKSCIATVNHHVRENQTFLRFTRHFKEHGVPVPDIIAVSEDERIFLQEDLGDVSLLNQLAHTTQMRCSKQQKSLKELSNTVE